jgi:hypothetical protein
MKFSKQLLSSLAAILTIAIFSCNSETEKSTADKDTLNNTLPPSAEPTQLCYAFVNTQDTVILELVIGADDTVSGNLLYQLAGKDRNTGTLKGVLHNDTILADYTFMSEGKQSVREIAFLRKDSSLTEGYTAMEEVDGKMQFKPGAIPEYKGMKLMLTNCKN